MDEENPPNPIVLIAIVIIFIILVIAFTWRIVILWPVPFSIIGFGKLILPLIFDLACIFFVVGFIALFVEEIKKFKRVD